MKSSEYYLEKLLEARKLEAEVRRRKCYHICALSQEASGLNCGEYHTKLWAKSWYDKYPDDPVEAERQMSRAMGGY